MCDVVLSDEAYTYDAAGNVTDAPNSCFLYDTNNRLVTFNGNTVNYDLDGNMLDNGVSTFTYDSANRLITADGHTYTYNAENVRIRNLCEEEDTTYTYDTNCKLSRLLCKTTGGVTTKYVYGRGLIAEDTDGAYRVYHFDGRGSTVVLTDAVGNFTDTFAYDTYGKLVSRTGTTPVIFGYNGRDGVVTDTNGLIYMRARYYSPEMKRFVNADIVAGSISNAVTLNRFAYANGNPVSFVDPFGLAAKSSNEINQEIANQVTRFLYLSGQISNPPTDEDKELIRAEMLRRGCSWSDLTVWDESAECVEDPHPITSKNNSNTTKSTGLGALKKISHSLWTGGNFAYGAKNVFGEFQEVSKIKNANVRLKRNAKYINPKGNREVLSELGLSRDGIRISDADEYAKVAKYFDPQQAFWDDFLDAPGFALDALCIAIDVTYEISKYDTVEDKKIIGTYTAGKGIISSVGSAAVGAGAVAGATKVMAGAGTVIVPGVGTAIGAGVGFLVGIGINLFFKFWVDDHVTNIVENN